MTRSHFIVSLTLSVVLHQHSLLYFIFQVLCLTFVYQQTMYSLTWKLQPFDYFILLTIFANCILLALNTPLPEDDKLEINIRIVRISRLDINL